jgi:serpin B
MRYFCAFAVFTLWFALPMTKADSNNPAQQAASAGNQFAADVFAQVAKTEGNLCISPYSISSALQMTTAGAAGNTAAQMLAVLHWTQPAGDLPAASNALTAAIVGQTDSEKTPDRLPEGYAQISIANALFGQKGYPYQQSFLDVLSRQYAAPLQDVDFQKQPAEACHLINRWAAEKTHDRIQNAVPASAIAAATRLVLVDAIYFKAAWENEFKKSATQDQPFYLHGKDAVNVPLMQQSESFPYMDSDTMQAVELPYTGDFSLVVLLPKNRDGLAELEKSLTAGWLDDCMKQLAPRMVRLQLPKFKIEGQFELSGLLTGLGMGDAFDPQKADFSSMSSSKFCIDQVIHKTFIDLNEAGTEAAAVTAVTMRMTAMFPGHRVEPVVFTADHPFVFVLRHRGSGAILFMGRMADPR